MPSRSTGQSRPDVKVARAPISELVRLADELDDAVSAFLAVRVQIGAGRWEAPKEAWALSNLMIRNIEAVTLMARTDEVLISAAWSNARCAFEAGVRILWLLYPGDRFTSECRWLGMMAEEERIRHLVADAAERDPNGPNGQHHRTRGVALRDFREAVTAKLPDGYSPVKPPPLEQMLRSVNGENLYRHYREASQFVHGSMWAAATYRRHLGTAAVHGDFNSAVDWILPLRLCWLILRNASGSVLNRLPDDDDHPRTLDWDAIGATVDLRFTELAHAAVNRG